MTPGERHNKTAKDIVFILGRETESIGELCVVTESVLMGVMLLLADLHKCQPHAATALAEAAFAEATRRFAEDRNKRK